MRMSEDDSKWDEIVIREVAVCGLQNTVSSSMAILIAGFLPACDCEWWNHEGFRSRFLGVAEFGIEGKPHALGLVANVKHPPPDSSLTKQVLGRDFISKVEEAVVTVGLFASRWWLIILRVLCIFVYSGLEWLEGTNSDDTILGLELNFNYLSNTS